jgi:ABC-type transport system involved in multi-copper enzyme maturation permease subunit
VLPAPVLLAAAVARLVLLVIVPLIASRIFVEEKQSRTIELLFTSPATETEIILGKWLGAVGLFLMILALSPAGLALVPVFRGVNWRAAAATYPALLLPACGLLAIGECLSMSTRHQTVAAAGTIVISLAMLRHLQDGMLRPLDYLFCGAVLLAGWLLTLRAIRAQRSQLI